MRYTALLVCLCLLLAGCSGGPGTVTDTTTTQVSDTTATRTTTAPSTTATTGFPGERFDGDANANVQIYNPTNDTWNATYRIERNGTVVLNETRSVRPGNQWKVTTVDRPGNYTFTVVTDEWTDSISVRLPRAVGYRACYIELDSQKNGEFRLRVRTEV